MDRKKAEVRKRMEEQSMKKKKKGFMTPERKKKLRLLLRKKAAEELKKEQERKSAERRKVIDQRCGKPQSTDGMSESKQAKNLKTIFSISQKSLIQPNIYILKSSFLTKFTSSTPHFFTKITISKSYFSQKFTFSKSHFSQNSRFSNIEFLVISGKKPVFFAPVCVAGDWDWAEKTI